ncbi:MULTISPECIES: hypothetical protein [Pseudomonas]|uniref:Uncharacterized protein n=1 Tax=Pseudomonas quercus TaxID=2722792 RepID=A0ABX0YLD3_9PSED|nr:MULTISPECIES: hypothetical protein [Pseudomonas]MBF7144438.1 hypothetical protein [Pseudomonas sp. LY10J]NJP02977.1 hypothetical protein [Pseudomonas quercus]
MNTAALRELIERAHAHEAQTGHLARLLKGRRADLHPSITLSDSTYESEATLYRFVKAYLDQVPDLIDAAANVAVEAGIDAQVQPVLNIALEYFIRPPKILVGHEGLDSLLDEAYLAHRLVEEVNDLYIRHFAQPLIPLDTTVANLIAHNLIGEPFANELDEVVHHSVDQMLNEEAFEHEAVQAYKDRLTSPETGAAWKRWPCLSRQLGIEINMP